MSLSNGALVLVAVVSALFVGAIAGRAYERSQSALFVRDLGSVAEDQAAPLDYSDKNRPGWITGNVAMGIAVDSGEPYKYVPRVHSVGDFTVLRIDRDSGAVLAKCVP